MTGVAFEIRMEGKRTKNSRVQFKIDAVSLSGFEVVLDGIVSGGCVGFCGRIYVTGLSSWRKYSACKQEGSGKIR